MMAKTGLAATGNVNLVLNSVKLATTFMEKDPSQIHFTNFIWDGLDTAEQGIISSKKVQGGGFDDEKIAGFTNAMNKIYKDKKLEEGRDLLNKWMSENGGDVFETAYERLGKYVLDKDEFAKIRTKDDGIKAMKNVSGITLISLVVTIIVLLILARSKY